MRVLFNLSIMLESQMTPELQALALEEFRRVIWIERIAEFFRRLSIGSNDLCLIRNDDTGECIESLLP
jgi:hypothetical protein